MKPDDFESQLQRQPLRSLPQEWRAEILSAAQEALEQKSEVPKPPVSSWRQLLWPCPQAWAGLATVWLVIGGLNWVNHRTGSSQPMRAEREVTPEERIAFMEQQRLLATLLEAQVTAAPPAPPVEKVHPPRSDVDVERRRAYRRKDFGWA